MLNIKNIFTAAVIATSILCVADTVKPQAAKANPWSCNGIGGYTSCYNYQTGDRYTQNDIGNYSSGTYYNNSTGSYGSSSCVRVGYYTSCY